MAQTETCKRPVAKQVAGKFVVRRFSVTIPTVVTNIKEKPI
jgi:hypothetical protein